MTGLLSRNRQWVHQEYFSSLLVVPGDYGCAEEREEPDCNSISATHFLLCKIRVQTHGISIFSGSKILIP